MGSVQIAYTLQSFAFRISRHRMRRSLTSLHWN